MIRELLKPYSSRYGKPILTSVDTDIFLKTYFVRCLECTFCYDACCSHGVDVALDEVNRIGQWAEALEQSIGISRKSWFTEAFTIDGDFPGESKTRTRTNSRGCVFLNVRGRGCAIHRFCVQNNIDYHDLKPMLSCLFPITFEAGLLQPSAEVKDKTLICLDEEQSLYQGVRSELQYYFGDELISNLDALKESSIMALY